MEDSKYSLLSIGSSNLAEYSNMYIEQSLARVYSNTIPFEPNFAFGVGSNTKFINLTKTKQRIKLFYAVSHMGIVYDHQTNHMKFLIGHKNAVVSIAADGLGKWLVTADSDKEHSIVVWDGEDCLPVYTIFEPHGDAGICVISLSRDAKYLISIGKEIDPLLKFWIWSNGSETPEDTFVLKRSFGVPKDVCFDPNETTYFQITFADVVVFYTWVNNKINEFIPDMKRLKSKTYGQFQASTYVKDGYECISATSLGWVIIWGISFFDMPYTTSSHNNNKLLIKAIRLQKNSITTIKFSDNIIITGDVNGFIKLYDRKLKMLYWCQSFNADSIVAMRFNIQNKQNKEILKKVLEFSNRGFDDDSEANEIIYAELMRSSTKLNSKTCLRDFIISTTSGQMFYVDFMHNIKKDLIQIPTSSITSVAVHDQKPILCFGFANGIIVQFNYETCKPILNYKVMNSKEEEYNEITCIQYSTQGLFLACSTAGGHLWFLEPSILKPYFKKPFIYDHSRIHRVQFSEDSRYLAYYDSSMAVCLLKRSEHNVLDWAFHGRYIAHFKHITDLLFCYPSRLFSISEDRSLVEYDVLNSEPGKLELISSVIITQTGYPICFLLYALSTEMNEVQFLISTSEYKYLLINEVGDLIQRTFAAPMMKIPVQQFCKVPLAENYMLYSTDKYLGIQLYPLSGNPYKRVAMLVHPERLGRFVITHCGKYVFTYGFNDRVALMWTIKLRSANIICDQGGKDLQPYYCLLEGGCDGWLFSEMNALFLLYANFRQGRRFAASKTCAR